MIKLIVGTKGSGKTKAMIDMINDSVKTSKGNVVVVEKGMKLTYEVPNAARLIDLDEYKIAGGEMLYGFVAGLLASNYDITDLYIDGILKVLDHDINRLGVVLDEIAAAAGISRQGVHDIVKRCARSLEEYERKLHLVEKFLAVKEKVSCIDEILQEWEEEKENPEEIIERLRKLSATIIEEL